jgi:hypothetical protein
MMMMVTATMMMMMMMMTVTMMMKTQMMSYSEKYKSHLYENKTDCQQKNCSTKEDCC